MDIKLSRRTARFITSIFLFLIVVSLALGCQSPSSTPTATSTPTKQNGASLAIYLTVEPFSEIDILSDSLDDLELRSTPLITIDDIITYYQQTHEVELTPDAAQRIREVEHTQPFVVSVGNERIYGGAFWASYSSMMFEGFTIDPLLLSYYPDKSVIRIDPGYPSGLPSPNGTVVLDLRSDSRIIESLLNTGKLQLSPSDVD